MLATFLYWLLVMIRPLFGPASCYYPLGCTAFALEQLKTQPFLYACCTITARLLSCNSVWHYIRYWYYKEKV